MMMASSLNVLTMAAASVVATVLALNTVEVTERTTLELHKSQ